MRPCPIHLLSLFLSLCCLSPALAAEEKPAHHTADGYQNHPPVAAAQGQGPLFYLRRIWGSAFPPEIPQGHCLPEKEAVTRLNRLEGKNSLTWLGQSTFLFRINGKTILTDPFLTDRASPYAFAGGVVRYVPPGITIQNLPPIDMILVSHNHYDHLDERTLAALPNKAAIHVGVPLGLKPFFLDLGFKTVYELDWGKAATLDDIQILSLPAVHNSRRGVNDGNKTLWCSWAILSSLQKYYFAGDTGYSPVFQDIGRQHGPFDLAVLPIGAYEPRERMRISHVNPEEAVQIGRDIQARMIAAGHWGTIELSDEPHWEPPVRFTKAAAAAGMGQDRAWVMTIGDSRMLP